MSQLELVAYHCPQCGGNVKIDSLVANVKCLHCDCVLKVEPKRPEPAEKRPARARGDDKPPPFLPPREPTVVTRELGRFEITILRQSITESAREAMVWVPLDQHRAGVYLVRIVEEGKGSSGKPIDGPLGELAIAITKSLRERRDPGLAIKAALRAIDNSRKPGMVAAFAGVFDSEKSELVMLNSGVTGVLIHASVEEGRTISPSYDRGLLDRRQLRSNPDIFANRDPIQLARGDVLVVSTVGDRRSIHEALDKHWSADSLEIARSVHEAFWEERINSYDAHIPPLGDVLVIGIRVRGNSEMRPEPEVPLAVRSFRSKLFDIALAPAEGAFIDWRPLHSNRHQLVWLEGPGVTKELGDKVVAGTLEVSDGQTGDNDNPRRAGRDAGIPAGVKVLVLQVHDVHGKCSYWTRHWKPGFSLGTRSDRNPTHQQFDEGGDTWPREGGRVLLAGELPFTKAFAHLDQLPYFWSGGKASCLYELGKDHEDHATSEGFLRAAAAGIKRDDPAATLNGLGVVTKLAE
ncbi:MAG: hypothetical protein ACAI25_14015 [Planctomycetota bacterium]